MVARGWGMQPVHLARLKGTPIPTGDHEGLSWRMKESMQWSVASISEQETQPEASSPMDKGSKALHVLLQVVLPIRERKSELLLPFSSIH
jgi:hypothetical protein